MDQPPATAHRGRYPLTHWFSCRPFGTIWGIGRLANSLGTWVVLLPLAVTKPACGAGGDIVACHSVALLRSMPGTNIPPPARTLAEREGDFVACHSVAVLSSMVLALQAADRVLIWVRSLASSTRERVTHTEFLFPQWYDEHLVLYTA
jgi:hypothetical protein